MADQRVYGQRRAGIRTVSSEPLDDEDVDLPATLAHGLESVPAAGVLQFAQQGRHQPGADRTERGWPSAMAPPLTLTRSGSAPVFFSQARTTGANASLVGRR